VENKLRNYDDFTMLTAYKALDFDTPEEVAAFQERYQLDDEKLEQLAEMPVMSERRLQDLKSFYNDVREQVKREKENDEQSSIDWDEIVFEVDLLKAQEINLDYIMGLILERSSKEDLDKDELVEEIRRTLRASVENRAKEELVVDFINQADLTKFSDKAEVIESFYKYAQKSLRNESTELIETEKLQPVPAGRYIKSSLKHGYASEYGTELDEVLPKMSPLNPKRKTLKDFIFGKVSKLVEKYKGVGFSDND